MPVFGLPTVLESIINSIMTDSQLASYKIAGFEKRTTLVLRFDNTRDIGDISVSPVHHPPVSFRRKSARQIQRDRTRKEQYFSTSSTTTNSDTSNQHSYLKDETKNVGTAPVSDNETSVKLTCATVHNSETKEHTTYDSQYNTKDITTDIETTDGEDSVSDSNEDFISTHSQKSVAVTCGKMQHNNPSSFDSEHSASTHSIQRRTQSDHQINYTAVLGDKTDSELSDSSTKSTHSHCPIQPNNTDQQPVGTLDNRNCEPSDIMPTSNCNHRIKEKIPATDDTDHRLADMTNNSDREHSNNSPTQLPTHCSRQNHDDEGLYAMYRTYLRGDPIMIQSFKIPFDILKEMVQPNRNNEIKKLLLDNYGEILIIAETDDFIIDYSVESQKIIKFVAKTIEPSSPYERMRLRHIKTWNDDTTTVRTYYKDHVEIIKTALPLMKRYISK